MQAFGRALALEPYLSTVVLGGTAIRLARQRRAASRTILPQIAEGKLKLAFAHGERQARYDLTDVLDHRQAERRRLGAGGRARASSSHGDSADKLIVSARTAGERDDPTASRCSWWMRRRTASRAAATRCATARARRRSR